MADDTNYPPGETTPPPFTAGLGFKSFNARLAYIYSMLLIPDATLNWTPGTGTSPGKLSSRGGSGGTAVAPILPLTVKDASAKDSKGVAHPGRVRVYKGYLGGKRPAEMNLIDGVLPNGTDNSCYLTMPEGVGFVYGKILVDTSTGLYTSADVYQVSSEEEADGTYLYLQIAVVNTTNGKPDVFMLWTGGNWNPATLASSDGTILTPVGE